MALVEKDIADELVDLRYQMSLGHDYVPATDLEKALERSLRMAQEHRAVIHSMADDVAVGPT